MVAKGVQVFSVSAGQYMSWKDPCRIENPLCEPDVSGIPSLRRFLLTLPAEANYKGLTEHIFESLSDIEDQVDSIIERFEDDSAYIDLRNYLSHEMPKKFKELQDMSVTKPTSLIPRLWNEDEKEMIVSKLAAIAETWRPPQVHWRTFMKMLRENGIPLAGKAQGRNFNADILKQYKVQLKQWRKLTASRAEGLRHLLDEPVQALLCDIQHRLDQTPTSPDLKLRANDALKKCSQRISVAQGRLVAGLETSVKSNYLIFAIENDIRCPIARQMKLVYLRISEMHYGEKSRMAHRREALTQFISETTDGEDSVIDVMAQKVIDRQAKTWQQNCEAFTTETQKFLESFVRIVQNLLATNNHESAEHQVVRDKLARYFPEFQRSLHELKAQFPVSEAQRPTKKPRSTPNLPTRLSTPQTSETSRTDGIKPEDGTAVVVHEG